MKKKNLGVFKNSYRELISALFLTVNVFCLYFPFNGVYVVLIALLLIGYIMVGGASLKPIVPIIVGCFIWYVYSAILQVFENKYLVDYFLSFLVSGLSGLLISQLRVRPRVVVYYLCIIAILVFPVFFRRSGLELDAGGAMGLSYTSLRLIIPLICSYFFIKNKIVILGITGLLAIYLMTFVGFASRGAVLSVLVFIALAIYVVMRKRRTLLFETILLVVLVYISSNFIDIIVSLDNLLEGHNIQVYSLKKIIYFSEVDQTLDNGRNVLTQIGMRYFCESPLIGNGIGYFESMGNGDYVHNVVVQLLLEGGLLITIPFFILLFMFGKMIYDKGESQETLLYVTMLFCVGVILLFFSETFWRIPHFWYFIGYTTKIITERKSSSYLINKNNAYV